MIGPGQPPEWHGEAIQIMRIRVYATLRDLLGTDEITLDLDGKATAREVLRRLTAQYPALSEKLWDADGNPTGFVRVLLNGRLLEYLDGLDTPVEDRDEMGLFPPVGGG